MLKFLRTIFPSIAAFVSVWAMMLGFLFFRGENFRHFFFGYFSCFILLSVIPTFLEKEWPRSIRMLESDRYLAFLEGWKRSSEFAERTVDDHLWNLPKDRIENIIKQELDEGEAFVKAGQHLGSTTIDGSSAIGNRAKTLRS